MTRFFNQIYLLLLPVFFITFCKGQNKVTLNGIAGKTGEPVAQSKLIKTQGTNEYANIYCGLMDKSGNLWFGTLGEGVYRYDGKSFVQFTVKNGLCNNYIYSVMEDKRGSIWFGTAYGICKYNGGKFTAVPAIVHNEDFSTYTLPANQFKVDMYGVPSMENVVWSMLQDKNGMIWIGATTGVYCYDGISFTRFTDNKTILNKDSVHLKMIDCMLEDKTGNMWFCSGMKPGDEGIIRYDGKSLTRFKPYGEGWVRKVIEGKDGNLYFATRHNGMCMYDGKTFTHFTEKAKIDNGSVNTVTEDKAGNIWIATELGSGELGEDGGVWRYNGKNYTRFTTKDGLIHNGVFCIIEDRSGNVWFGTRNIGLSRYDGKTFTTFSE